MKNILRVAIIGTLHTTFYLWLIPFVIIPKFGREGATWATIAIIAVSVIIIFVIFRSKDDTEEKDP